MVMIDTLLLAYAALAAAVMLVGLAYKIARTIWLRATMKREMNKRIMSFYPARKMPFLQAFWHMNVTPFTHFWMRANPVTFVGHVLYHFGFFYDNWNVRACCGACT